MMYFEVRDQFNKRSAGLFHRQLLRRPRYPGVAVTVDIALCT